MNKHLIVVSVLPRNCLIKMFTANPDLHRIVIQLQIELEIVYSQNL